MLGRGVVVGDGEAPDAWADAPEILLDEAAVAEPADVVGRLHAAWAGRTPVVVRLAVDPATFRTPPDHHVEPWTLPAGFELWHDRLQFLVWANTYDARRVGDEPVWWWARKAARLGAAAAAGAGDVVLPDGRAAWVDGGPRVPFDPGDVLGLDVVHRESVERDRLDVAPPPVAPSVGELAADQAAAVGHGAGPARVIAPAGSGKTRVLTERLRHLVADRGWERDAVLAVAYNKKAKEELDARTATFRPRTRTLNALGLSLLGQARGRSPVVLDERDLRRIVERLAPTGRRRVNTDPIAPYLEALGAVRLGLRDPAEVEGVPRRRARPDSGVGRVPTGAARPQRRRLRRPDLRRGGGPAGRRPLPRRGPARPPPPARRRVPGPDAGACAAAPAPRRARPSTASASATTTRSSTATPAPTPGS